MRSADRWLRDVLEEYQPDEYVGVAAGVGDCAMAVEAYDWGGRT